MRQHIIRWLLIVSMTSLALTTLAQDPTATPIGVEDAADDQSAAPGLPGGAPSLPDTSQTDPATTDAPSPETDAGADTCPTLVQQGFSATELVCESLASGQACIGNGTVQSQANVADVSFAQPGDIVPFTSLDQFTLQTVGTANNVWSVVTGSLNLDTTGSGPATATAIFFGDVSVADAGTEGDIVVTGDTRSAQVLAERGLNVRRTPENAGVVVWQLGAGERVTVTGITPDDVWLRITIPNNFAGTGWVYAPFMQVEGGSDTLPTVTVNSPLPDEPSESEPVQTFGPMQALQISTQPAVAGCGADVPPNGLLLQSPSGVPADTLLQVNGTRLAWNGTVFVQAVAGTALLYDVLEGTATITVDETETEIRTGQRAQIPLDNAGAASGAATTEAISLSDYIALPTSLLSRQFALDEDASTISANAVNTGEAEAETAQTAPENSASGFASPTPGGGFAAPTAAAPIEDCLLIGTDANPNIRSGPSTEYPAVGFLEQNASLVATGRNTDTFNIVWYETERGWLRVDTVNTSGDCASVPLVDAPLLPATATPDAGSATQTASLTSSVLGDICAQGQASATQTSDGTDLSLQLGGVFTATAGTSITVTTQGGQLRPEFGDYIQIQREDGMRIIGSEAGRVLALNFDDSGTFVMRFSAANGDTVSMTVQCNS